MTVRFEDGWARLKSGGIDLVEEYLETGITRYPGRNVLPHRQFMPLYE